MTGRKKLKSAASPPVKSAEKVGEAPPYKKKRQEISKYHAMWLFAMFDLPVDTPTAKRQYSRFRKILLKQGFSMLQFSVYARFCSEEARGEIFRKAIRAQLPSDGQVRLLAVTDVQFGKMEVFNGKKAIEPEDPPQQLLLF